MGGFVADRVSDKVIDTSRRCSFSCSSLLQGLGIDLAGIDVVGGIVDPDVDDEVRVTLVNHSTGATKVAKETRIAQVESKSSYVYGCLAEQNFKDHSPVSDHF